MKMTTKHILQKWFLCLSLLVFFCAFSGVSASTVHAQNPQKVEMSLEQFNSLRQTVTELQKQSTAQKQDSQKLKTQLTESQKELTKAQVYLTDYKQNLTTLQKQTDSLNKSVKRMERQRDLAWVVAGGLLVGLAVK